MERPMGRRLSCRRVREEACEKAVWASFKRRQESRRPTCRPTLRSTRRPTRRPTRRSTLRPDSFTFSKEAYMVNEIFLLTLRLQQ